MYYSSIAIIALIVHLIINNEAFRSVSNTKENSIRLKYRSYLISLTVFFLADAIWGLFYDCRWVVLTYIDTWLFFISMCVSVFLWCRAAVAFTANRDGYGKILSYGGVFILAFQVSMLFINLFTPLVFRFTPDKEYEALPARYIALLMQMVLFMATAVYAFVIAARSKGEKKRHHRTVGFSSLIMAMFILLQMFYPLMPFYSLGCMFGVCLIHSFIYKDKDIEYRIKISAANRKAYKDGLTGVGNKLAYLETLAEIETDLESGALKEYAVAVFDLNGLKTINDKLGHAEGDRFIKLASELICNHYRHSPVFRIGGDEFVAILRGDDYLSRDELDSSFRKTIDENNKTGQVVVSSGLAIYDPETDESYNDVFKRADELMYIRKQELKKVLDL